MWHMPLQVLAASSSAAVFAALRGVPPIRLAAWRLQCTALLLTPGAVYEYCRLPPGTVPAGRFPALERGSLAPAPFTVLATQLQRARHTPPAPHAIHRGRACADAQGRARRSAPLLLASGGALGIHFGLWVWGILHTSLTHALLFVCVTPVLIAAGMWALRRPISTGTRRPCVCMQLACM